MIVLLIMVLYIASVLFSYHETRKALFLDKIDPDLFMIVIILLPFINLVWGFAAFFDDDKRQKPINKFLYNFFKINKGDK